MIESDIEDYVRWFTVEREWENWDAPWENEDSTEEIERKKWAEYYESVKTRSDDVLRWIFEIEWNGRHIGWVSSYHIDEKYEWIGEVKDNQTVYRAIALVFANRICMVTKLEQKRFELLSTITLIVVWMNSIHKLGRGIYV